ncbi:MAG: hypothetical protein R3C09_18780 [Pirellulaceae bacterium]
MQSTSIDLHNIINATVETRASGVLAIVLRTCQLEVSKLTQSQHLSHRWSRRQIELLTHASRLQRTDRLYQHRLHHQGVEPKCKQVNLYHL